MTAVGILAFERFPVAGTGQGARGVKQASAVRLSVFSSAFVLLRTKGRARLTSIGRAKSRRTNTFSVSFATLKGLDEDDVICSIPCNAADGRYYSYREVRALTSIACQQEDAACIRTGSSRALRAEGHTTEPPTSKPLIGCSYKKSDTHKVKRKLKETTLQTYG